MSFCIDFTFLLRKKASLLLDMIAGDFNKKDNQFYIVSDFNNHLNNLINDRIKQCFFSDAMSDCFHEAYPKFIYLEPYLKYGGHYPTAYKMLSALQRSESHDTCLVTGNETEFFRLLLAGEYTALLLVTDNDIYYVNPSSANILHKYYSTMKGSNVVKINPIESKTMYSCDDCDSHFSVTADGIISLSGAEADLLSAGNNAIKRFRNSISRDKIEKIKWLIAFKEKKPLFSWPSYMLTDEQPFSKNYNLPVGYLMDKMNCSLSWEEIFSYESSYHDRWEISAGLLFNVLYLYIYGIQVGDYNNNNFAINENLNVIMMDTDSFVIENYPSRHKSVDPIDFQADYSKKLDTINADYVYLAATVFCMLTDGRWPYRVYDGDDRPSYIMNRDLMMHNSIEYAEHIPSKLIKYFNDVLGNHTCCDPFELLNILLSEEDSFTRADSEAEAEQLLSEYESIINELIEDVSTYREA